MPFFAAYAAQLDASGLGVGGELPRVAEKVLQDQPQELEIAGHG